MESKTGKIALAVFGSVLMITFLLPAGMTGRGGAGGGSIGEVDGEPIGADDVRTADILFGYSKSIRVQGLPLPNQLLVQPELQRIQRQIGSLNQQQFSARYQQAMAESNRRVEAISDDKVALYLLLREAETISGVTDDDARQFLLGDGVEIALPNEGGTIRFSDIEGEQLQSRYIAAAKAAISMAVASRRYGDVTKVSRPLAERIVASQYQEVTVDAVAVPFDDFVATVDEPTDAELQAQFDKYKDVAPGTVTADNQAGFGYLQPAGVRLAYLQIERSAILDSVVAELVAQPVAAREQAIYAFFNENRALFASASTQPATRPSTRPTTQPSQGIEALQFETSDAVADFLNSQAAELQGDSLATWQAFINRHDDVVLAMVNTQASQQERKAVQRAESILSADYATLRAAGEKPDEAMSRTGVAVTSAGYLDAVADAVGEQTGVRPQVIDRTDPLLPLNALASPAIVGDIAGAQLQGVPFLNLIAGLTPGLYTGESREQVEKQNVTIEPMRPGPMVQNRAGDAFLFRLTDATPAAAPASMNDVQDRLLADLRRSAAFEKAKERAAALVASGDLTGDVVRIGPFVPSTGGSVALPTDGPLSSLDLSAQEAFANGVVSLVADASGESGFLTVIELPTAGIALATRLASATSDLPSPEMLATALTRVRAAAVTTMDDQQVVADYFNPQSIARRTGFEADE